MHPPGECVDFPSRDGRLLALGATLLGDLFPRIGNLSIELIGVQAMHDAPGPTTERNRLHALPRSGAARAMTTSWYLVGACTGKSAGFSSSGHFRVMAPSPRLRPADHDVKSRK
jgi:hypothetical protein